MACLIYTHVLATTPDFAQHPRPFSSDGYPGLDRRQICLGSGRNTLILSTRLSIRFSRSFPTYHSSNLEQVLKLLIHTTIAHQNGRLLLQKRQQPKPHPNHKFRRLHGQRFRSRRIQLLFPLGYMFTQRLLRKQYYLLHCAVHGPDVAR